jgi:hypothetical protein
VALSCYYNYDEIIFKQPSGVHQWRQCDGASIARNYYYVSMNFFAPRLSMTTGNDGKMVSEFPIVYYMAAIGYKVFGFHDWFIRAINLAIFFVGLFFLLKAIYILLNDWFYALFSSLLIFASALVADYANNFLPDVPALSFTFAGYYYYLRYGTSKNNHYLQLCALAFTFVGLLKVTSLIGLAALIAVEWVVWVISKTERQQQFKKLAYLFVPLIISGFWIAYSKWYNATNGNGYMLTSIKPIWQIDAEQIKFIIGMFKYVYLRAVMYRDFINALPYIISAGLILFPTKNKKFKLWMVLSLTGCLLYVLLFFQQFVVHDYYIICSMFMLPAAVVLMLLNIRLWSQRMFNSYVLKLSLLILFCVMTFHGHRIFTGRKSPELLGEQYDSLKGIDKYLESIGVHVNDKVISLGDKSTCISLYLMNRRGRTEFGLPYEYTAADILKLKEDGIKYLIVNACWQPSEERKNSLTDLFAKQIGDYSGTKIFVL